MGKIKPISGYKSCLYCAVSFPYRNSLLVRGITVKGIGLVGHVGRMFCSKKCSLTHRNKSIEQRTKISSLTKGRPSKLRGTKKSIEYRKKCAERVLGDKSPFWRGGVSNENNRIRHSLEYRLWREAVFKRDNWTCQWCYERGGILQADHIKPFAYFPDSRFAIDNGRTLCYECHKKTETYLKNGINRKVGNTITN